MARRIGKRDVLWLSMLSGAFVVEKIFSIPGLSSLARQLGIAEANETNAREFLLAGEVVLVAPGTLPKTSSGKRQRGACRERYASGSLEPLAVAP